jgi:hypothetical protein
VTTEQKAQLEDFARKENRRFVDTAISTNCRGCKMPLDLDQPPNRHEHYENGKLINVEIHETENLNQQPKKSVIDND